MAEVATPANELRQVKQLMWNIISEKLNPVEVDEVRRALGSSAIEENEQLMMEAEALAEIIGEVRRRTDVSASSRRLYENPGRTLVEGELRLLVQSIKRCASGDFAEVSGRAGGGGGGGGGAGVIGGGGIGGGLAGGRPVLGAAGVGVSGGGGGGQRGGGGLGPPGGHHHHQVGGGGGSDRPGSGSSSNNNSDGGGGGGGEISWGDIGNGGVNDPAVSATRLDSLKIDGGGGGGANGRAEKLLASDGKERRLLDYVTGSADALAISAGTPRTPPSRPASSRSVGASRPGSVVSDGALSQSSAASMISNPAAAVEHYGRNINVFDVDKVAAPLRELLAEERAALLDDVEYLQSCLEDEAEMSSRLEAPPPDVHDLKDYSAKLSKVWVEERERAEHIVKVEKMLGQPPLAKGRVGKLRTLTATLAESGAGGGGGSLSPEPPIGLPPPGGAGWVKGFSTSAAGAGCSGAGAGVGAPPAVPKPPGPPPRGGRSARSIAASAAPAR